MLNLLPDNFRELFSFISFIIGALFSFFSLSSSMRDHALRTSALLFILSSALYANNTWCYFASIFIIATAVTHLDFLQNLAAIIRGSKEYFDYRKSSQSPIEVVQRISNEVKEIERAVRHEQPIKSKLPEQKKSLSTEEYTRFSLLAEDLAIKHLEKKYGHPIQRYVRIQKNTRLIEFDGIMHLDKSDVILELKTSWSGLLPKTFIKDWITSVTDRVVDYQLITRRNASLRFIFIGDIIQSERIKLLSSLSELIDPKSEVEVVIDFISFNDLGIQPPKFFAS